MTYRSFEDLPVWQEAIRLADAVYDLTENPAFKCSFSLRDQIERSSMSVCDNIAEGFERGSTAELLQFLYIARGSAGETRSKLRFMNRRPAFAVFKTQIERCILLALSCGKHLRGWAETLQNSEIKGQRHLNDKSRAAFDRRNRAEAARKKILESLPYDHPLRVARRKDGLDPE